MRRILPVRVAVLTVMVASSWLLAGCVGAMAPGVAPGTRACIGLPQATCARAFEEAEAQARERGTVVVGIVIRCTTVCTDAGGEAERSVTYGDGRTEQGGFGWQSAGPLPGGQPVAPPDAEPRPSLPVVPTCVGLDAATCEARALESMSTDQGLAEVVAIVVRCTPGPCTPTTGDGDTTITYADGTSITIGWGYRDGP